MRTHWKRTRRSPGAVVAALILLISAVALDAVGLSGAADGAAPAPAKFLGPVLSIRENGGTTIGRDGGFSVGLPNGQDFWVFADSPRYQFMRGKWRLTGFLGGSTAAMGKYTPGKPLTSKLTEVRPGGALKTSNQLNNFMPAPQAWIPGENSVPCAKYYSHRPSFSVRWPLGAALMPDKQNIIVPYVIVCVLNESSFHPQGWGFSLFNYKTQKFTVKPYDVYPADRGGLGMSSVRMFGSPIVTGKKITFYSWRCCDESSGNFRTTVDATAAALKNPASYVPQPLAGVPITFNLHVANKAKYHNKLTMYVLTGDDSDGAYSIYTASAPAGPWTKVSTGVLPKCAKAPRPCHSMALHPELSPAGRLFISYHLAGFGPGVATEHPYPHEPLRHVVSASVPCNC
jgi:hypothetical protein